MPQSPILDLVTTVVEVLVIPLGAYIVTTLKANSEELKVLRTVLIGVDGKNGMRSRMGRLEKKVERLALLQAARHGELHTTHHEVLDEDDD